ncbi:MAG: M28 family metallopeptidase [Anaerolineae bacterium]|nr:M28 family metallopeptidase [Anaerolineae bacterium]
MPAMEHIRHLAETIGPRGSTTPQEAEAARYAARVLKDLGLEPVTEPFTSARSAWYPYVLFTGLALLAEILFWAAGQTGAAVAAVLTAVALASVLLELAFRPNPIRWLLPKGRSQNVWARRMPTGEVRRNVVVMGHLDTHRTPLAFSTDRWVRLFSRLVPIGLASAVALLVLFVLGAALPGPGLLWRLLSLPFALVVLGVFLITLQADFSPYTAGANDNATGAGIVLSLAERLGREPLAHTAVWLVLSGCEEVGCYGAEDFARRHQHELGDAVWITLDSVGGAHSSPAYLTYETFLLTVPSDPQLLALAERIAARHPEWGAHPHHFRGAYTEGSIAAKYGFRVLTFTSHRRDGVLPEWHRPTDTVDHLDPQVVEHTEAFVWELLREIDRER